MGITNHEKLGNKSTDFEVCFAVFVIELLCVDELRYVLLLMLVQSVVEILIFMFTAPAPPNIGLITSTNNSLFVTWSSVSTAESYVLMYNEMTIKTETSENNYTIPGLDSNTKYTIKVQAEIDNCTSTDFSQPEQAVTGNGHAKQFSIAKVCFFFA